MSDFIQQLKLTTVSVTELDHIEIASATFRWDQLGSDVVWSDAIRRGN